MKFQSEKKELWRYASKNLTAPVRGTTRHQPLPHRLPHQRPPQTRELLIAAHSTQSGFLGCCDDYGESSTSMTTMLREENVSTPPPPYSSVPELDGSKVSVSKYPLMFRQQLTYPTDGETELSLSTTDSDTGYNRKVVPVSRYGCNFANIGDIMLVDDYERLKETSTSSSCQLTTELEKEICLTSPQPTTSLNHQVALTTPVAPTITFSTTSFAATAAKILRNCCGGTFGSSNSITVTPSNNNNNNTCDKTNYEHPQNGSDQLACSYSYPPEQYFNTLMKHLKASQISSLLKAVKSRHDQVVPIMPPTSATNFSSSPRCSNYQTNCILVRRAEILGEEPYVIVCRLFFWRDLKNASQLKRLPVCPNERDPVYVCCNPLHWCRIIETETAPPPYQNQRMNQYEDENSLSLGNTDPSNIRQNSSDLQVRVAESVTTDGQDRLCSSNWCEVAYWEMGRRVGERYPADTPTINIFSDNPYTTSEDRMGGMCLRELIEKRTTPSPNDVQHTRQKIGLGVTLSQEWDGVWLYNRSTVPVFVYSPTLTESWFRVCRVEPGNCLKAFDKYRALSLVYPAQFPGVQTGPIDKFSMCISFGKGWGFSYKRRNITLCPCWLEVFFKPQR